MVAALVTGAAMVLILVVGGTGVAAEWAPGVTVILTVLGFLASTVGRDEDSRDTLTPLLDRTAEELASAVREQWQAEARVRRLQDPEPLPVRWTVVDSPSADHWDNIVGGANKPAPADLAGRLDRIIDVFARIPSRRMVVLGRPGAGKSVLAIRFTLDMLAQRDIGGPVPVIFPMSTWDPDHESLHEWLRERLTADFTSLGAVTSSGRSLANELLASQRVLPVLDGLDELTGKLCATVIRRLNAELDEDTPVLVTCRTAVYTQTATSYDVLTSALVVELLPLTVVEFGSYLERTARRLSMGTGSATETVWSSVLKQLQQKPLDPGTLALREVLSTPLMVAMARSVYSDTGHDPAELLQERFNSPAAIEAHLLDAFIPVVFTVAPGKEHESSWTANEVRPWLAFLARHLERQNSVNLAWWELDAALPAPLRRLAPGLLAGCFGAALVGIVLVLFLPYALINLWDSGKVVESSALLIGGVTGLTVGLILLMGRRIASLPWKIRQSGPFLRYQVAVVLAMAAFLGILLGAVEHRGYSFSLVSLGSCDFCALVQGLIFGAAISVIFGVVGVSDQPAPLAVPWRRRTKRRSLERRIAITTTSSFLGAELSTFTNLGNYATRPGYVIPILAGAIIGVAVWFSTGVRHLTPPTATQSIRRPMLRRLGRDFIWGLLICFAVGVLFGLVLGTVGGAVGVWRAELNDGFPPESSVTATAPYGTRFAVDHDGWKYSIASDGTKTVEPPYPVTGVLIVNPRGVGPINLPDGSSILSSADRWAVSHTTPSLYGPQLCHEAPFLRCSLFTEHIRIRSKDDRAISIVFHDGQAVEDFSLVETVSEDALNWLWQHNSRSLFLEDLKTGLIGGLILGGLGGVACGLYRWLETPADITRSTSPGLSLRTDRSAALARGGLITALTGLVGLIVGIITSDIGDSPGPVGQLWLAIGPVAVFLSAWGRLLAARVWLSATGRLPWRLMAFLADAHRRGVLRQSGAVYQFRHLQLQQQLAARPTALQERGLDR